MKTLAANANKSQPTKANMNQKIAPPRPPFKLHGTASIKHLNVRKEGPDDEKIIAVDVKMIFKKVDRKLCGYFDDALEAFLWRGDTDALITRNIFLSPVEYCNEIASANVVIGAQAYGGCDVKKFTFSADDGGVMTVSCSVSLYPSSGDVATLAKLLQEDERVSIDGPPDLLSN